MTDQEPPTNLRSVFLDLADRQPDVEAILAPGRQSMRFGDIPGRLQDARDALASFGIGPGHRAVSVLPRGPETRCVVFGVASCATYVPLNPAFSHAEFTANLTKLRPSAVIVPERRFDGVRDCATALESTTSISLHGLPIEPGRSRSCTRRYLLPPRNPDGTPPMATHRAS